MQENLGPVMVWTKYGLMPEASLTYSHEWKDTEEFIAFTETYKSDSGEVVKQSTHVLGKKGLPVSALEQGVING